MPVSRPAGDTGGADPVVAAALAAYAAREATEHAVLTAVAASRLLVPVVAVLAEANARLARYRPRCSRPFGLRSARRRRRWRFRP